MTGQRTDASESVSRNVRRLRHAHGWTQAEAGTRLSKLTGMPWSVASWSAAEAYSRRRSWTANELVALSQLFCVTVDELLTPQEPPTHCPTCGQEVTQ